LLEWPRGGRSAGTIHDGPQIAEYSFLVNHIPHLRYARTGERNCIPGSWPEREISSRISASGGKNYSLKDVSIVCPLLDHSSDHPWHHRRQKPFARRYASASLTSQICALRNSWWNNADPTCGAFRIPFASRSRDEHATRSIDERRFDFGIATFLYAIKTPTLPIFKAREYRLKQDASHSSDLCLT
jgi:hypothetical protein